MLLAISAALLTGLGPLGQDRIDHVDFYGLRSLSAVQLQESIGLFAGSAVPLDRKAMSEKLKGIDGVVDATVILMESPGSTIVLVGILENGTPEVKVRPQPRGADTLPAAFHAAYDGAMEETLNGFGKGVGGSDDSQGHSLSKYPPARAYQKQLVQLSSQHTARLRKVLRSAANPKERAVAVHALGYCPDKKGVVADLAYAMADPDPTVRNNAVRALSVIARWSTGAGADIEFDIDVTPLLAMLESIEWTDRNKSAALLDELSKGRSAALLSKLRENSIPALVEMASWHSSGHAAFSVNILARLAGLPEEELAARSREVRREGFSARAAWVQDIAAQARAPR